MELLSKEKKEQNLENKFDNDLSSTNNNTKELQTTIKNDMDEAPTGDGRIDTPWDMRCPPGSHWEWYFI